MKIDSSTSYTVLSRLDSVNKDKFISKSEPDSFTPETDEEINSKRALLKQSITQENKYAEIKVNGEIVATVYNSGLVVSPDKYSSSPYRDELASIYKPQDRVNFLSNYFSGEVSYFDQKDTSQSYSFSDSLAKILNKTT